MYEALYYEKLEDKKVRCNLCPHHCIIKDGKIGICMGKENRRGVLYAKNYAQTTSIANDPIEKKPLYNFYPGTEILSISPNSCNLSCKFCQNWEISQMESPTQHLSPERAVEFAKKYKLAMRIVISPNDFELDVNKMSRAFVDDGVMINSGDTAWVLISTALVMMMTAPGLAFFYGGWVRKKNMLSVLMQCFMLMCIITLQWVIFGYSLSFGPDIKGIIGSLSWAGLHGVGRRLPDLLGSGLLVANPAKRGAVEDASDALPAAAWAGADGLRRLRRRAADPCP